MIIILLFFILMNYFYIILLFLGKLVNTFIIPVHTPTVYTFEDIILLIPLMRVLHSK